MSSTAAMRAITPSPVTPLAAAVRAAERLAATTAAEHLPTFARLAWRILEPDTRLEWNWHLDLLCEYLQAVTAGDIRRLIINVPPRTLKSTMVTIIWPAWTWLRQPTSRWLFASYSSDLSTMHSVARRDLLRSDWYRRHWPEIVLSPVQDQKAAYGNTRRGSMVATSVGGTSTGKGGEYLVLDDPINPEEAQSDAQRASSNGWIRSSFLTRQNDRRTSRLVCVMQRLHEEDTTGMLLGLGDAWTQLKLPAIAEGRTVYHFPMSGRAHVMEEGALLMDGRLGRRVLAEAQAELGSYGFAGQMQQNPAPSEGGLLKRRWWRFWYPAEGPTPAPVTVRLDDGGSVTCPQVALPEALDGVLASWDLTFKEGPGTDYVVGQAWGHQGTQKFLLSQQRARLDFPQTCAAIKAQLAAEPRISAVLVEDKANGPAVISVLKRQISHVIPVNPQGGKAARVHAVAPSIENGTVYLPHPDLFPWVGEFIERATAFPNAAHDDEVDAMSQALLRLRLRESATLTDTPDAESEDTAWARLLDRLGVRSGGSEVQAGW